MSEEPEHLRPETAKTIRELLANIDAGPGEAFFKEREKEQREFEESVQAQIMEMSRQSKPATPEVGDEPEEKTRPMIRSSDAENVICVDFDRSVERRLTSLFELIGDPQQELDLDEDPPDHSF